MIKLLRKVQLTVWVAIIAVILFTLLGSTILDSDFGWHLRLGEIIVKQGIVHVDPFSYTMPSYPFVDHEWLSNVVFYFLYHSIGWQGMAFVFSLLAVGSVYFLVNQKQQRYSLLPLLLALTTLMARFAIKTQVFAWAFFSIVVGIVVRKESWMRWRWGVPFLMLLWVNMHGSFALGIIIIFLACLIYQDWKQVDWMNLGVFVASLLVTFINPYGWRIWHEVWMQMSDIALHFYITEWGPFWTKADLAFAFTIALVAALGWRYRFRLTKMQILLVGSTFLLALSAVRHIPLFTISVLPIVVGLLFYGEEESKKYQFGEVRFRKMYLLLVLAATGIFGVEFLLSSLGNHGVSETRFYPVGAVMFLKQQPLSGNIFAPYTWGGYLDWKLPDQKVFIDGRMPSFRWSAPPGESDNAFLEYRAFVAGRNQQEIVEKYDISYILLPIDNTSVSFWQRFSWFSSLSEPALQSIRKGILSTGWTRIYADDRSEVYRNELTLK